MSSIPHEAKLTAHTPQTYSSLISKLRLSFMVAGSAVSLDFVASGSWSVLRQIVKHPTEALLETFLLAVFVGTFIEPLCDLIHARVEASAKRSGLGLRWPIVLFLIVCFNITLHHTVLSHFPQTHAETEMHVADLTPEEPVWHRMIELAIMPFSITLFATLAGPWKWGRRHEGVLVILGLLTTLGAFWVGAYVADWEWSYVLYTLLPIFFIFASGLVNFKDGVSSEGLKEYSGEVAMFGTMFCFASAVFSFYIPLISPDLAYPWKFIIEDFISYIGWGIGLYLSGFSLAHQMH